MNSKFIHRIHGSLRRNEKLPPTTHSVGDNTGSLPLPLSHGDRRIDSRFAIRTRCTYELLDGKDQDATAPPGEAYSLNLSTDGILLLLDRKPEDRQLVAMRNPALQQRAVALFEVRWLRHLPVGTTHKRYLVGCHLTFGRFPYFLVQCQHLDHHISGLSL